MSWKARPTSPGARAGAGFRAFRSELRRGWRPGVELSVLRTVDSTNALARRTFRSAPDRSLAAPRVFVAWGQTAGRGRRRTSWSSPPGGGVYASILVAVRAAATLDVLPLLLPVTTCEAARSAGASGCGIKWPNDLLVGGRKLGGLLIEAVSVGGEPRAAVLGLGLNYRTPGGSDLAATAVGLAELAQPLPTLAGFARALLDPLLDRLEGLEGQSHGGVVAAYRALSVHRRGDPVLCRTAAETIEGEFAGFDERGFLQLAVGSGVRRIAAGEVVERRPGERDGSGE